MVFKKLSESQSNGDHPQAEVDKAREAEEIQRHETEVIKLKREAELAQLDIDRAEELVTRLNDVAEREHLLVESQQVWQATQATELAEIQKHKAENEKRTVELDKRSQEIKGREDNITLREKLVLDREELMNSVERKKLAEVERYNSLSEALKRAYPQIKVLIAENANLLIKNGMRKDGNELWDDLEHIENHSKDGDNHCANIVACLLKDTILCNDRAAYMARNPKLYAPSAWNLIVDNLEKIYELLPEIKPRHLPSSVDGE